MLKKTIVFFGVLSGVLSNTSIYNTDDFGVPLFYAVIPFLFWDYVVQKIIYKRDVYLQFRRLNKFVLFSFILLFSIITAHIFFHIGNFNDEIKQLVARSLFLLYVLLFVKFVVANNLAKFALTYTKLLLKIFVVYGLYQWYAEQIGLPLFLDFLRNNQSYTYSALGMSGWIENYRIYSVWAEPSFSSLPIGLFLFLLFFYTPKVFEKTIWYILALLYALLTYSRIVWLVVVVLTLTFIGILLLRRFKDNLIFLVIKKVRYILFALGSLLAMSWVYIAPAIWQDLSSIGRASSLIIGVRIFLKNPVLGTGMNTFGALEYYYSHGLSLYKAEEIVHNLFIGYGQQMGVGGVIYGLLPIVYITSLVELHAQKRLIVILMFLCVALFGGDLYYLSVSWFILSLVSILAFGYPDKPASNA